MPLIVGSIARPADAEALSGSVNATTSDDSSEGASQVPGANANALPGLIRLAVPVLGPAPAVFAGTADYGYFNRVGDLTAGAHRYGGTLAASLTPLDYLSLRGQLSGRMNSHEGEYGSDSSAYGEPELAIRLQAPIFDSLWGGLELEGRVVGGELPSVDLNAFTPTVSGLLAYRVGAPTWIALNIGYRKDNSAEALDVAPERYRTGDRLLLGVSSFDALEFGVGASHKVGGYELLAEVTGEVLLGGDAPSFTEAPFTIGVGARRELSRDLSLRAGVEVSPFPSIDPFPAEVMLPNRARLGVFAGLNWNFGATSAAVKPTPPPAAKNKAKKPQPSKEAAIPTGSIEGTIVDESGETLSDVKVTVVGPDGKTSEIYTDANGHFVFDELQYGKYRVTSETPGMDDFVSEQVVGAEPATPLSVTVYESVPAGQVKGHVLSLQGEVIRAEVTISPGKKSLKVDASGAFSLDLAPGTYTVRFKHPDYRNQVRRIRVQDKGVVVLNIALER